MKKLIILTILLSSFYVKASCLDIYKKSRTTKAIMAPFLTTSTYLQGILGIGISHIPAVGAVSGTFNPSTGYAIFGAHFSSMYAYPVMGGISLTTAIDRNRTYKLLQEAEVGMGGQLANLADNLSEDLEMNIDESMVAEILQRGNSEKIFCPEDGPYSRKKVIQYITNELIN